MTTHEELTFDEQHGTVKDSQGRMLAWRGLVRGDKRWMVGLQAANDVRRAVTEAIFSLPNDVDGRRLAQEIEKRLKKTRRKQ